MADQYTAWRAAEDARKSLPARLRERPDDALCAEAAAAVEHYQRMVGQLRQDMRDEQREAQRDARAAAAEGYWQGRQEADGNYGSY